MNEEFAILGLRLIGHVFVPGHFLLFWALTFMEKLYTKSSDVNDEEQGNIYFLLKIFSSIFISPISLLSTSITVAYVSCFILTIIRLYLWGCQNANNNLVTSNQNNRRNNGWEEGVTTLFLTSLTALTSMNENAKIAILLIISFVIISSLLQSILEISEPAILSLNFNHNINYLHHIKILLLCIFLFIFPIYVTYVYAQIFPINFWISIVFSTSLMISARVLDLLIVHCLFWWDSCQEKPNEFIDDIIYFSRSFTKILEFLISVSLVVVGIWEAWNNQSNIINVTILAMHCYFNIWRRILQCMRIIEANKIAGKLKKATVEEIDKNDDRCSICYMEMQSTNQHISITDCNHLFHRSCIKKWLAIQNKCPLCASEIIGTQN
ncbi:Tubulin-specific chaperone cofactor E-like protein [Sarcoptes scabiei]|nr:Tubulin-specific chaperone cofactor E-like protein [Sarcoptes scabiei]